MNSDLNGQLTSIDVQGMNLKAKVDRFAGLIVGECPNCTSPIDTEKIGKLTQNIQAEMEALRTQRKEILIKRDEAVALAKSLRAQADVVFKNLPTAAQIASAKATAGILIKQVQEIDAWKAGVPKLVEGITVNLHTRLKGIAEWIDGEDISTIDIPGFYKDLEASQRAKAAEIMASYDSAQVQVLSEALQKAEQASIEADRVLANVRERKAANEAENKATEASLTSILTRLSFGSPATALETTMNNLVAARTKAFEEMEGAKTSAFNLNQKLAYIVFWDRAFAAKGSMRSFLLDQSIKQLNVVIQDYTRQHFGGRMHLTFNADLTVQERYGRRSGGQRKWTDLSVLFATFSLVRQRSRYRAAFLGLDELFDALDAKGRKAAQDLVVTMATQVKRIFVITHADVPGATRVGAIQAQWIDQGSVFTIKPV